MNGIVTERGGRKWKLMVEVADKGSQGAPPLPKRKSGPSDDASKGGNEDEETRSLKKTNRVIIRNLSFYAKESHVRSTLKTFGEIVEFTLPTVSGTSVGAKKKAQHRGFCFATFKTTSAARNAVAACAKEGGVEIKGRQVAIDWAVSKDAHEQTKRGMGKEEEEGSSGSDSDSDSDGSDSDNDSDSGDESDGEAESDASGSDSDSDSDSESAESDSPAPAAVPADDVSTNCTAFVRNVPFDCTNADLFKVFLPFGKIDRIYIVKDSETGVNKGTAFVKFQYSLACSRAIEAGKAGDTAAFVTERDATAFSADGGGGIVFRGRRLLVDLAVDKGTAESLKVERDENGKAIKKVGKDKRNLYLKEEASIKSAESWEEIGRSEKEKRQNGDKEMSQKLRSPLFFINPFRLSFRNLNKDVDEKGLKKLIVEGITRGLGERLVTETDVTNYLQATGLPQRECIGEHAKVPEFDDKNVKQFIPSLYIDRIVLEKDGKKSVAGSRGYGFVEFTHHIHALGCLRALNNQKRYSKEWAQGGSRAEAMMGKGGKGGDELRGEDGKVKWPRLIVEFTCENKAKAKKQTEKKEKQAKNAMMQKAERNERKKEDKKEGKKKDKKKGRGQLQREKKRKAREDAERGGGDEVQAEEGAEASDAEGRNRKPRKEKARDVRQKMRKEKKLRPTKEDKKFDSMVDTYKKMIEGTGTTKVEEGESKGKKKKKDGARWFD